MYKTLCVMSNPSLLLFQNFVLILWVSLSLFLCPLVQEVVFHIYAHPKCVFKM